MDPMGRNLKVTKCLVAEKALPLQLDDSTVSPPNQCHIPKYPKLVGGFNPFEKIRQIGSSPQVGGKIEIFETTT